MFSENNRVVLPEKIGAWFPSKVYEVGKLCLLLLLKFDWSNWQLINYEVALEHSKFIFIGGRHS